ncbi:Uncharacterised protein [Staphylococcus agnetis]|nr:Uncharacterised protein [Staphylococcus agnetis]
MNFLDTYLFNVKLNNIKYNLLQNVVIESLA